MELIRDLRGSCGTELNRYAYMMPEGLSKIFTDLENAIANILSAKKSVIMKMLHLNRFFW